MLLAQLRVALATTDALSPAMSVSSMQHGIRYARSRSVKTRRNTTMPRSMYSFLVSPFTCIESPTVPQSIIPINLGSSRVLRSSILEPADSASTHYTVGCRSVLSAALSFASIGSSPRKRVDLVGGVLV